MAGKFKFKVPTADEMTRKESEVKPLSLFENYKKQKDGKITETSGDAGKVTTSVDRTSTGTTNTSIQKSTAHSNTDGGNTVLTSVPQAASSSSTSLSSGTTVASVSDTKPSGVKAASTNSIIVNFRQRGNPILKHIRNVPWEYNSIIPDYVMGKATCAFYLSLRYHQLNPSYIHNRLKELGKGYDLRVLLAQVDVKDPHHLLKDLAKICILADLTLILAFSPEEAGRYLETYKVYENKPPDVLMEKVDKDYVSKLTDTLTSVKSVNKTDSMTLLSKFKTMEGIITASKEDLSLCAGFGPQKAQRLYDVFHEPFLKIRKRPTETSGKDDNVKRAR